ncbi:MAG: MBL fold metallo-hydrolase [Melioribacteraceae bacterium]|nr:MBL fold metallo-hydrolase [Melioribacteraceae bacterium]
MKKRKYLSTVLGFIIMGTIAITSCSSFGASASGDRLTQIKKSKNYKDGIFVNTIPTVTMPGSYLNTAWKFMIDGSKFRTPIRTPVTEELDIDKFMLLESEEINAVWLGHATILIKIDDSIILTDPVFSKRVSPFSFVGPKRFFEPPISIEELPELDAIIISHDHYDHLDAASIKELDGKTKYFVVPLGIGAHLEKWGINSQKIIERNWWEKFQLDNSIEIICTPARHFSGRGLLDRNKTLWASWVIKGEKRSLYFGGDTGIFPGFKDIGEKYGPFDITILPIGAYGENWPFIHLNPEEAVEAHINLNGDMLLPIHWGTFDLALHSWTEPAERLIVASKKANINFIIPKAGEIINKNSVAPSMKWWHKIPTESENCSELENNIALNEK